MNITTLEQAGRHLMDVGAVDFNTMTVEGRQLLEVCGFSTSNAKARLDEQVTRHDFEINKDFTVNRVINGNIARNIYSFTIEAAAIVFASADNSLVIANRDRKESRFGDLLSSAFPTVDIKTQHTVGRYRIDFYMPEHDLAIEYDEHFHKFQQDADRDREDYISTRIKCDFIRVNEGDEGSAIIEIFKAINKL